MAPLGGRALFALAPELSVGIDRSRCVRHRCTRNECTKCSDACPTSALSWGKGGMQVAAAACTLCLRCLAVCPTAALAAPELSLRQVLTDLAAHPRPVLGCQGIPDTAAHARLPCLGYLGHPELIVLLALIFTDGLTLNLTDCADCPNGPSPGGLAETHARLDELVPGHRIRLAETQDTLDFQDPAMSRRQLFSLVRDRSARTARTLVARLQSAPKQGAYGDKRVPAIRRMLLQVLEGVSETQRQALRNQLFGRVAFTADCTGAERCVGVCPTGAIQPRDGHPPDFNQDLCVSCASCQLFCRNQGVVLEPSGDFKPSGT